MSKPRVLILGGVGFIGRNLVTYIVENNLADKIRVADKAIPKMSYLSPRQAAAFEKVEFIQANLSREPSLSKAFADDGGAFDYVFNCAGLTKYGQVDQVYQENIFDLSVNCAKKAAETGVKKFIEISTAQIYSADKSASDETDKTKPWTSLAEMKLKVEEELAKIDKLNYVIVRPATVYGSGDRMGLTPRLVIGAVYKHLGEKMKLLWSEKLRLNTVHVDDVSRAMWLLAEKGERGDVFNLADKADSSQGSINDLLTALFGIETGFFGSVMSNLAKLNMSGVTEESNEKHMQPWAEMCRAGSIENSPLSPYLDQELLYNNSLCVDGSKIEKLGFSYSKPAPTVELLKEVVQEYIDLGVFPKGFLL